MITMKDFMSTYLLAKTKTEQVQTTLKTKYIEPVAAGLQAVMAKQLKQQDNPISPGGNYAPKQER